MKTLEQLKEAAEAHGWEVDIRKSNAICLGDIGAGESATFSLGDMQSSLQFTAVRGDEEATIATNTYMYACIWPRLTEFEMQHGGTRTALRHFGKNDPSFYDEASEWLYSELTGGGDPYVEPEIESEGWLIAKNAAMTFTALTLYLAAVLLFILSMGYYWAGDGWRSLLIGFFGGLLVGVASVMLADLIRKLRRRN